MNAPDSTATVIIEQTSPAPNAYYTLTRPDGSEIGATSKDRLMRYARGQGWSVDYRPAKRQPRTYRAGLD